MRRLWLAFAWEGARCVPRRRGFSLKVGFEEHEGMGEEWESADVRREEFVEVR